MGGWELTDIDAKFQSTPLLHEPSKHSGRDGDGSVAPSLQPHRTACEPPARHKHSQNFAYMYFYAFDMAYITLPETNEAPKA